MKRPTKCVYLNNQPYKARPTIANINCDKTLFYPFTVNINKWDGSCNTIYGLYARLCVPNSKKYECKSI